MVKRILKRILVFFSVACLVLACLPSVSFAIDPVSGAAALAGAIDAYGMAYGVGTVFDVSSSSGVSFSFEGLWDEFSAYQSNAGSQFDYDSFIDDYNQNRSLYGFNHSSGKFAAWSIDAESAEIFDQFWNWLLTGPAEMSRVDNEYFQFSSSQIGDDAVPLMVIGVGGTFDSQPISTSYASYTTMTPAWVIYGNQTVIASGISNTFAFIAPDSSGWPHVYCVAQRSSNFTVYHRQGPSYSSLLTTTCDSISSVNGHSYRYGSPKYVSSSSDISQYYLPRFSSISAGIAAVDSWISSPSYTDTIGVKSYSEDGVVDIPNPYGQDYVPTPLEIVTNIPWDSTYDDTDEENGDPVPFPPADVPLVMDDILTAISAEDYSIEEDPQDPDPDPPPPAPSEFFVPLLPVGLPSFDFSFSGIWHYVREWVSSLGAWFTTLFTIWNALPYAMVVPVYATAVVVIVLGVYKRFFM